MEPANSEIYRLDLQSGKTKALTERYGPDNTPVLAPDGNLLAFTGYDDQLLGYQTNKLYVMDTDGGKLRVVSSDFDRNIGNIQWAQDGKGYIFNTTMRGTPK